MMDLFRVVLCLIIVSMSTTFTSAKTCKRSSFICCPPDKIKATLYTEKDTFGDDGSHNKVTAKYDINLDYENKQISIHGSSSIKKHVYLIMRPNVTYFIDEKTQKCALNHSISFTEKYCLPKSSSVVGPVIYGNLNTTAYMITESKFKMFTTVTDDCIAINRHETKEEHGSYTVTSSVYSDVKTVVDESTFVIPSYCPQVSNDAS